MLADRPTYVLSDLPIARQMGRPADRPTDRPTDQLPYFRAHALAVLTPQTLGVVLGPALTNCHPYSAMFWMCFGLVSTSGAHSGYFVFGAEVSMQRLSESHCIPLRPIPS